jgi:hypothetical protein
MWHASAGAPAATVSSPTQQGTTRGDAGLLFLLRLAWGHIAAHHRVGHQLSLYYQKRWIYNCCDLQLLESVNIVIDEAHLIHEDGSTITCHANYHRICHFTSDRVFTPRESEV